MLQKPSKSTKSISSSSLTEREALLSKREAALNKREAALAKREACLSNGSDNKGKSGKKESDDIILLNKDGEEVNFFEYMRQSPLYGLKFGRRR